MKCRGQMWRRGKHGDFLGQYSGRFSSLNFGRDLQTQTYQKKPAFRATDHWSGCPLWIEELQGSVVCVLRRPDGDFFKLSKIALVNSYYTHSSAAIFKPRYIRKSPHSGKRTTEVDALFELKKNRRGLLYVFYEGRMVIFFKLSKIALVNSYNTHSIYKLEHLLY